MKKIKLVRLLFLLTLVLGLVGCSKTTHSTKGSNKQHFTRAYVVHATPTLYFHGALSNYHSEESLVKAAQSAGVTNSVIRADVNADGKVKLVGTIPQNAVNPIVMVNYKNNLQIDFYKAGRYATNVVRALQEKYGITKINMIGHSLGNMSIMYYMLENDTNSKLPRLQKQVDIAGHFDGVDYPGLIPELTQPKGLKVINGKPNKMNKAYREMLKLRQTYPKNQVDVLNVIGNDGKQSDGVVKNVSSLSLGYLVQDRAKSYQVLTYTGHNAEHGRLTFNSEVERDIINFLWQ